MRCCNTTNVSYPIFTQVKCTIWADDWIDEVYYNGKDVRSTLTGGVNGCCKKVFLEFDHVPGAALAIAAADTQEGDSAAFSFSCKSTDESCPWNFTLKPGGKMGEGGLKARAFGISGPHQDDSAAMTRPKDKQPPKDWTSNDFDDSTWGVPGPPTADWGDNPMWYQAFKWTFFRLKPSTAVRVLPVSRKRTIEIGRQLRDVLLKHFKGMIGLKALAKVAADALRTRNTLFEKVPELFGTKPTSKTGKALLSGEGSEDSPAVAEVHATGEDTSVRKADELTPMKRVMNTVDHLLSLRYDAENAASAADDSGWGQADKTQLFKEMLAKEAADSAPDALLTAMDSKNVKGGSDKLRLFLCDWLLTVARELEVHKYRLAAPYGEAEATSFAARLNSKIDVDGMQNILQSARSLRKSFEELLQIRAPASVGCARATTLASHPGMQLVFLHKKHKEAGEWIYYEIGMKSQKSSAHEKILLKTDGEFFWCDDAKNGACLDVSHWRYRAGNTVNLVAHHTNNAKKTKSGGGGRSFSITPEGSLLCLGGNKDLVLGVQKKGVDRLVLVSTDSPDRCIFEQFSPSLSADESRVTAVVHKLRELEKLAEKMAVDAVVGAKVRELEEMKRDVLRLLGTHDSRYGEEVTSAIQHRHDAPVGKHQFHQASLPFTVPKHMPRTCKLVVPSKAGGLARELVFLHKDYKNAGEWIYYEMALKTQPPKGQRVALLKTDGEFFWCEDAENNAVLDVSCWQYKENNTVNLVAHHSTEESRTKLVGGGRSWQLCSDGSLGSRGCQSSLVVGMNETNSRLILVKPGAPNRCILMLDDNSEMYPKVCTFGSESAGVDRLQLDSSARGLLVRLAEFPSSMKQALEDTCGQKLAKVSVAATKSYVKLASMLTNYAMKALEPAIATRIKELITSLESKSTLIQTSSDQSTAAAAASVFARLNRGDSAHETATDDTKTGPAPSLVEAINEARDLISLAKYASSASTAKAAAQLTPIAKPLYLSTLESAFLPSFLLGLLRSDRRNGDDVVQKHWQKDFKPLPAYKKATQSLCLSPQFLRRTVILDQVHTMSKGRLAKLEAREALATDDALEKAALEVIQQGWGLKTAAEARVQTDELSGRNVIHCIKDCFNHVQKWQRPYFTLALSSLGGADASETIIKTKLAEVCDRSIHCPQMKVTAFNVLVRHAAAAAVKTTTLESEAGLGSDGDTAEAAPATTAAEAALRRVYECLADYVDQHKDAAFRSSFVEPSKYYAHHSKLEKWVENNVETHAINYYAALLNSTLGVHLPFMPLYWEDWPETLVDFWSGLDDSCWKQFSDPLNFGLGHATIKCMRDPTGFITDAGVARAQFPQGKRPTIALDFANDAVNPKCPAARTKVIALYLERFAHFFSWEFFLPKAFHHLNSELRPEHHGFRKASEVLYQMYRAACPAVATADNFVEFCFEDDMFTVFSTANVAAFWEWMGLVRPGTAALVAASSTPKDNGHAQDGDVAASTADAKADKVSIDDQALASLNKQLSEAMRVQDIKLVRRLMKERDNLVNNRSK